MRSYYLSRLMTCAFFLFILINPASFAQTTYYVDDDTGDDARTPLEAQNPATPWLTIQHAINTVAWGDIVVVFPGTYQEALTIQKSLTLRGATYNTTKFGYTVPVNYAWDDNVETILDCPPTVTRLMFLQDADDITIEGLIIQALYRNSDMQNHLIYVQANTKTMQNIVFRNNVIGPNTNLISQDGTMGRMNLAISVNREDYGFINSLITGNKIFDSKGNGTNLQITGSYEAYSYSISGPMDGTYVEYNEIYGSHRSGIEIAGGVIGLTIRYNDVYGNSGLTTDPPTDLRYGNGINLIRGVSDLVSLDQAHGCENVTITRNSIYNNQKNGIYLGPVDSALTFTGNQVYGNGWDGIRIDMEEHYYDGNANWNPVYNKLYDIHTICNNVYNNSGFGSNVIGIPTNGFVQTAHHNWWGDAGGPGGQGPGAGNGVSDYVGYSPWVDDMIYDYERILTNVATNVGPAGGQVIVTPTSVPGAADFLDVYQTGQLTDPLVYGEDFTTNLTGCVARFKLLWGIIETGTVTANLVFDYSGQPGIPDPSKIVILGRDNVLDAAWDLVPITSRDDVARTITIAGVTTFGEYVLGLKGKIWNAGAGTTDWNDPFNWWAVGVPVPTDDILIPTGLPFYPETNSGPIATARDIVIENGAHVIIPVNNGLTAYGVVYNDGYITIPTTATGEAGSFIDNGTLLGSGTFNFNRNMTGTGQAADPEGWHLMSSPVDGMSCWDIFDYWINDWSEPTNEWYSYSEGGPLCVRGADLPWNTMKGYSIKRALDYECQMMNPGTGDIIEFTSGMSGVHTGAYSVTLTGSNFDPVNPGLNNWNLLGNPYPSPVDYEAWYNLVGGVPPQVDNAIYLWDDDAQVYRAWVNGVGFTPYIPAVQGFFMHVNTVGNWNVSINNPARTHNGANQYFKSTVDGLLVLQSSGNGYSDEAYIRFLPEATEAFDGKYDAYKLVTDMVTVPQIFTVSDGIKYSINSIPSAEKVNLGFIVGAEGTYSISIMENNINGNVILEDLLTGQIVDLTEGPYVFSYSNGENENRFLIHFGDQTPTTDPRDVVIMSRNNLVYINNQSGSAGSMILYNIMGQQLSTTPVETGLNTLPLDGLSGHYIVKVVTGSVTTTAKIYIP